ncbi:MAG: UxaA family hydrolase [Clostridium sp.]|jgi:altronate dehydratase large subunit|uniref:UxaA family hydrolase n=1 Tax=Clostridium sp. TaxID=1506 RepID=UPI0025C04AE5|nr:UxaA family hydrolase [Clostridium sp.]MCH3965986.1 UxaA family hydrolase [Clostridium sp.]MCI1715926.1 UxaA family hydrolase [Clostridium sp.]MCI1800402.1 UxaA family hydrolase [Clostridium sp.]MCI1814103.1 UxaA family hydrolase [Clostridium sp.]MCI1871001.1 UxaA family hydrolase [Clostridium sp.]
MNFLGYRRPDGKVGIRNHILILPTCSCSSETARAISNQVEGTTSIINQNGCAQVKGDLKITMDILSGLAANPNVYGTVLVGLGCENAQPRDMYELIKSKTNKPLEMVIIQEEGGTLATIKRGAEYARRMRMEASMKQREKVPLSELIVATNCGGSDLTSGLASNPVLGNATDRLVDLGSTSILCETTEFIGAEHILAERAATSKVKDRIYEIIKRYEEHLKNVGENLRNGNPSPGNKAGGITTLEEKSLGCIHKGGHRPIEEVTDYGVGPSKKGLVIMDTPGYDIASVTGLVAGGAQIVVFTTGRGTPTGNGLVPVLKMTANKITFNKMRENIDFDASPIIKGTKSIEEMGKELLNEIVAVANGKVVKAEAFGFNDIAISRLCNYV